MIKLLHVSIFETATNDMAHIDLTFMQLMFFYLRKGAWTAYAFILTNHPIALYNKHLQSSLENQIKERESKKEGKGIRGKIRIHI